MKSNLPNLLTLCSGISGMAIVLILMGEMVSGDLETVYTWVFGLTIAAVFFDTIDGPVARLLRAQSPMGAQLDNLCDATTFGLAVGVAIVTFLLEILSLELSFLAYVSGFLWLSAVLIRLARFQVDQESTNRSEAHLYFRGLCSPVGALFAVALMQLATVSPLMKMMVPFVLLFIAGLMVSNIQFADLPKHYLGRRRPIWEIIPFVLAAPFISIPGSISLYLIVFILLTLGKQLLKKQPVA